MVTGWKLKFSNYVCPCFDASFTGIFDPYINVIAYYIIYICIVDRRKLSSLDLRRLTGLWIIWETGCLLKYYLWRKTSLKSKHYAVSTGTSMRLELNFHGPTIFSSEADLVLLLVERKYILPSFWHFLLFSYFIFLIWWNVKSIYVVQKCWWVQRDELGTMYRKFPGKWQP